MSHLSILAGKGGLGARRRVARALLLLVPRPDREPEFRATARAILDEWDEVSQLAPQGFTGKFPTKGMLKEDGGNLTAMLIGVAESGLPPGQAGGKARRYLAALVVEIALRDPAQIGHDALKDLARVVRLELKHLQKDDASRAPIPDPKDLLDLVCWMDRQPQRSTRFPAYFWDSWRRYLREAALQVVFASADATCDPDDDPAEELAFEPDEGDQDDPIAPEIARPRGLVPPEPESEGSRPRGPGLQRVIANALLSTYTSLEAFSVNSTTVLTPDEAEAAATALMSAADKAWEERDLAATERALGRALILASGTAAGQVPLLRWTELDVSPPSPAGISLDGRWLVRHELVPANAAKGPADVDAMRTVWIPIPEALRRRLLQVNPAPTAGGWVLGSLQQTPLDDDLQGPASNTALRRTFLSEVARMEPLGITGAQWASGDTLGIDSAPLYYDRFPADGLADLIERVTFPWFGERPGRARPRRPSHYLGSRVTFDVAELRRLFGEIREGVPVGADLGSLVARLSTRMRNLVHGLVVCTGHRPNDSLGELTLAHFDAEDRIAVLGDKAVGPDWPHRPVALAGTLCDELQSVVSELRLVVDRTPRSALGQAAALALSGRGPLLLRIASEEDVAPYNGGDYVSDLSDGLRIAPNFARHALNHALTGRIPEALRIGQLGWHGSREGTWAETSPWSGLTASAQLQKALEQHLKHVGWRPIGKGKAKDVDLPLAGATWCDEERAHRKAFCAHVAGLRRGLATRLHNAAKALIPRLQSAISARWPMLQMDDRFVLTRAPDSTEDRFPLEVTRHQLARVEAAAAPGSARSLSRLAVRNALSIAFRRGQTQGVVRGALPRRTHWSFGTPSLFLRKAPAALRACRRLHQWLIDSPTTLSLEARTMVGLLLWGAYPDIQAVRSAMAETTTLSRLNAHPDVLLAEVTGSIGGDSEAASNGTLAFHGLAALCLARWHRERESPDIDLQRMGEELSAAIPTELRAPTQAGLLEEIAALTRTRNALTMDGVARLVGTGRVRVCAIPAAQIAACYDKHPVTRTAPPDARISEPAQAPQPKADGETGAEPRIATVKSVMAAVARVQLRRRSTNQTDAGARRSLGRVMSVMLRAVQGGPTTADLLARFVVVLLDEGGARKDELVLSTIYGYLAEIAYPLASRLGDRPLSRSGAEWQEAFTRIIAGSSPLMRWRRARALQRFHHAVSRQFDLPDVDMASLSLLAGSRYDARAPDLLSPAQLDCIARQLEEDTAHLAAQDATADELHTARAREIYFATMRATSFRPGETHNLIAGDVYCAGHETRIAITRHRLQRLKTTRARRRVRIEGSQASRTVALIDDWMSVLRRRARAGMRPTLPVFGVRDDAEIPMDREELTRRIGQLIRWATDRPDAVLYSLRKTAVWERIVDHQESDPKSLWPLRDLLARSAHGSLLTTLAHYVHDPIAVFRRWFNDTGSWLDSASIGAAAGRSLSRVRRIDLGSSIRGGRSDSFRDRVVSLLARIPIAGPVVGTVFPAPRIQSEQAFHPDVVELDSTLRAWLLDGDLHVTMRARWWPLGAQDRLARAIAGMRTEFHVGFARDDAAVDVVVGAPRRLDRTTGKDSTGGDKAVDWMQLDADVMAEMGAAWLRFAAVSGLPDGIPGRASEWDRWHARAGYDFSATWSRRPFGSSDCRVPSVSADFRVRGWQLLRWHCLLNWLRLQLAA